MDVTLILVTLLSLALAAVMTVVSWRLAREERRRSEARVAALATEIHPSGDLPLQQRTPVATANDLFTATTDRPPSSSRAAAMVVGAAAVVLVAAFVWSSGSRSSAASSSSQPSMTENRGTVAAPAKRNEPNAAIAPLELTALTHERDANRLTVRGLVRNPANGGAVQGITAVVFLFDRSGDFVTSGRAPVDALPPGGESPFVVTIPDVKDVGRYRVSFRTDDRILPHVDRRERPLAEAR
jgi:Flp pilus assembly protein TadB